MCPHDIDPKAHPVHPGRKIQRRHRSFQRWLQICANCDQGADQNVKRLFCEVPRRTQPYDLAVDPGLDQAPVQINVARKIGANKFNDFLPVIGHWRLRSGLSKAMEPRLTGGPKTARALFAGIQNILISAASRTGRDAVFQIRLQLIQTC